MVDDRVCLVSRVALVHDSRAPPVRPRCTIGAVRRMMRTHRAEVGQHSDLERGKVDAGKYSRSACLDPG